MVLRVLDYLGVKKLAKQALNLEKAVVGSFVRI
jgi:hypothetical protein